MFRRRYATTWRGRCCGRPCCRAALAIAIALIAGRAIERSAAAQQVLDDPSLTTTDPTTGAPFAAPADANEWSGPNPQSWTESQPTAPDFAAPNLFAPPQGWQGGPAEMALDEFGAPGWSGGVVEEDCYYLPCLEWLGLRQYATHGRNVGVGWPMVGTSWLNRPCYFGGEYGAIWMTRAVDDSIGKDVDSIGGLFVGWDWDHYWGSELKLNRATPELVNADALDARRNDVLWGWSYSNMYYPWGDSWVRPYWRWGIGNTKLDFPLDTGERHDEWLFTFPIGLGVKYPVRRWLAVRAELTDYLSLGQNGIPTQNNITLTFGLEMHVGAHPRSYWPWNPSRHIW